MTFHSAAHEGLSQLLPFGMLADEFAVLPRQLLDPRWAS
jgi:hypothetical protein